MRCVIRDVGGPQSRAGTDASPLAFVFSPDVRYVAAVSEDGCLRIIDALSEKYHAPDAPLSVRG